MTITNKNHEIFSGLTFTGTNNDELQLFASLVGANAVTGIVAGSWRGNTDLLGVAGITTTQSIVEIPVGTNMNGTTVNSRFLMIGVSEHSTANLTPTATQLIENACYYLMGMSIPNSISEVEGDSLIVRQSDGQISVEGVEVAMLTLFGITGRQIMSNDKLLLITTGISRGVYILSVRTKDGAIINRKVIL
jgi:hypothetical protein